MRIDCAITIHYHKKDHIQYTEQVEERPPKLEAFEGDEKANHGGW